MNLGLIVPERNQIEVEQRDYTVGADINWAT